MILSSLDDSKRVETFHPAFTKLFDYVRAHWQELLSVADGRLNLAVTALESGAEELLQNSLAESCAVNISSSCAVEDFAGGLNLGVSSEESFGAASLFDFDSSTKTVGALLAV